MPYLLQGDKQVVIKVDYNDVDRAIAEYYSLERDKYGSTRYEFVADQECGNDSDHEFNVKKAPLDEYQQRHLDNWKAGNYEGWMTNTLLQDMANNDVIEEGTYLISVGW